MTKATTASIVFVCLLRLYFSQQPRYQYIILIASKFYFSETRERVKQGDFPVMLPNPKALFAGKWRAIMSDELFQDIFLAFLQPLGGALVCCARNRKSFRHMVSGINPSELKPYYLNITKHNQLYSHND